MDKRNLIVNLILLVFTIITAIAAILVVPEARTWLGLHSINLAATATSPSEQMAISDINISDLIVSANANTGVQFTAPTSGNYQFTIQEGIYCTSSTPTTNLCRSIIRGYLERDIVWKDWNGLPHPMEPDYEMGCWEQETSNNRNCSVGRSVVMYMNAQQYIRWIVVEDKNSFADNQGSVVLNVAKLP
jgi:hypothetical protein